MVAAEVLTDRISGKHVGANMTGLGKCYADDQLKDKDDKGTLMKETNTCREVVRIRWEWVGQEQERPDPMTGKARETKLKDPKPQKE